MALINWVSNAIQPPSQEWQDKAWAHQQQLTKPPGSLGVLEEIAVRLCAMQNVLQPELERVAIRVFAADHGVVNEGVSAFPQIVTVEMIKNFAEGGAAISVLASVHQAEFSAVNVGAANPVSDSDRVVQRAVASGTKNFCVEQAMSAQELQQALEVGSDIAEELKESRVQLFIAGEMGIGNTTTAAALACSLMKQEPEVLVGAGTGVDQAGWQRKVDAVRRGLALHQETITKDEDQCSQALATLQCVGGFEIAALVGSYLRCAQLGIPSLVDGFICSVSAMLAIRINPACTDWLFFSHQSAEVGHEAILQELKVSPLLQLNMRLGEGSGAATALPLLRLACELHNRMATFEGAGVSDNQ